MEAERILQIGITNKNENIFYTKSYWIGELSMFRLAYAYSQGENEGKLRGARF